MASRNALTQVDSPADGREGRIALARAAADGDLKAAQAVLEQVVPGMQRAVWSVLGRHHPEIDDTLQHALIALIQDLGRFRGDCKLTSYAGRIAVNAAIATKKRWRRSQAKHAGLRELEALAKRQPSQPTELLEATRRRALVRDLMTLLPDEQAEVLGLHVVLGMTLREVAAVSTTSVNTVKSRLRLAKQALRSRILADPELATALEPQR